MVVRAALALAVAVVAYGVGRVTRRHVPELVAYLAVGASLGPTGIALIGHGQFDELRPLVQLASAILMFLVGERLTLRAVRSTPAILTASVASYLTTAVAVYFGARLAGADDTLALMLATLSGGGAPMTVAAIVARRRAPYADALVAFHAACDVIVVLAFAVIFPALVLANTPGRTLGGAGIQCVRLGLAGLGTGIVFAFSLAALVRRTNGRRRIVTALVVSHVVASGAVSYVLGFSLPFTALVLGAVTASQLPEESLGSVFAALAPSEPLLYLLVFTLAGAAIRLSAIPGIGLVGVAYIVARGSAKALSGFAVARVSGLPSTSALRFGFDSLPQAGATVALAAVASAALPGRGIATVTLGSMILFEAVGAVVVRRGLDRHDRDSWTSPSAAAAL